MLTDLVYGFAGLFPPGLDSLVVILFWCFFAFSVAGVLYAVIRIVSTVKGLIHFGR